MALVYIKQRSEIDCGIAAVAMACHLKYDDVAADLVMDDDGTNDGLIKDWLCRNGWAWQEKTENLWKNKQFNRVSTWPPHPFASTHICFVEATRRWHYCVMDFDGRVYDPWDEDRQLITHPDYKRVGSVIGLFKIVNRQQEIGSKRE